MSELRMDGLYAPVYDQEWGAVIDTTHQECLQRFLDLCPVRATILDAACGTGKYWPLILARGRAVRGTDQSQGMLARAAEKFPNVPVEKIGLQEMEYEEDFEGAICVDAMEMVSPEDWPLVLYNLWRALKPDGYLYFTVELAPESEIQEAFTAGQDLGLPVVYGEWAHKGGYHYYPQIEQVKAWLKQVGFRLIAENVAHEYYHFLVQRQGAG